VDVDPIARFFAGGIPRRLLLIGLLLGMLATFSHLLPVLAAFAVSQRVLAALGGRVAARVGLSRGRAALLVAAVLVVAAVGGLWFGGTFVVWALGEVQAAAPGLIGTVRQNPVMSQVLERVGEEDLAANGWEAAVHAMTLLREAGYVAINVAVGFGLALIHAFEEEELNALWDQLDPRSVAGTLVRWVDHVGDGLAITVQLQVVVAACNAVLTFPALLLLGLPYQPALLAMIFLLALVPVVGNFLSGAVLAAVAWPDHGWLGVGVFTAITLALGKIEGFVLNPRLAAQHVRLPGFVLTVSLILWEDLYGFTGFFLSFPFLYTVERIRQEMREGLA
jgi:predicted PurR-regulated permease PerM